MAACGSLRPLFEKPPMPENSTLMESLSTWNQIKSMHSIEQSSFTEIFGELHFKDKNESSTSSSPPPAIKSSPALDQKTSSLDSLLGKSRNQWPSNPLLGAPAHGQQYKATGGFPECLQLCTEALGFESSDDVEDSRSESGRSESHWSGDEEEKGGGGEVKVPNGYWKGFSDVRSTRRSGTGVFPPPISCIGRSGKPWICFKSYKGGGRFVLREIRIPTQEFLHASREDGRLKLHLVQPEDRIEEEGDGVDETGEEEELEEEEGEECINQS